jgi:hypothetical protein
MQPIRLISLSVHSQKGNPLLIPGIHWILSPCLNPWRQMINLAILRFIDFPSSGPRLIPGSILSCKNHALAIMGNIELFGSTVRRHRTVRSETFHGVDWRADGFRVESCQVLIEVEGLAKNMRDFVC